jgi:hypothetical protein
VRNARISRGGSRWVGQSNDKVLSTRFSEISRDLVKLFLENGNIELRAGSGRAKGGVHWKVDGHVEYYCPGCSTGVEKMTVFLRAVCRREVAEEGDNVWCYLEVLECFFHSCAGHEINNGIAELLTVPGKSEFMESVRKEALLKWIEEEMPTAACNVRDRKVTRIHLPEDDNFVDARYQWRIDRKKNVPVSVPKGKLAQSLGWNLYRVLLRERNMVGGFTRHIAVSHLHRHQGAQVKVGG